MKVYSKPVVSFLGNEFFTLLGAFYLLDLYFRC